MPDTAIIVFALIFGLGFKQFGFPPLLGYLLAGFAANILQIEVGSTTQFIADIGVTLLLFTIGLKLNIRELGQPQIWAVSSIHMIVFVAGLALILQLFAPHISALTQLSTQAIWIIAFALSFSSTVFAIKVFDEHGEGAALHAKLAVGILIMQDLAAVVFLGAFSGKLPNLSALWLLLLIPCRPILHRWLHWVGHGELLVLFGITTAVAGAQVFEYCGIKGDLGALILGVLLGGSNKTNELSKVLLSFKEVFLVGFFITIGVKGFPSSDMVLLAVILGFVVVIKPLLFYALMALFHLRARTSLLSSLSLATYSEFGLIVAAIASKQGLFSDDWVSTIVLALSISFFLAAPFNARGHALYNRFQAFFHRFERSGRLVQEADIDLGDANVLILGLGRVGSGAYDYLQNLPGNRVAAIEELDSKIDQKRVEGFNVYCGDATDWDFWNKVNLERIDLVLISLTLHAENLEVVQLLKGIGYKGRIAVIARFPDEQKELIDLGCTAYNLYAEAGYGFAEHVHKQLVRQSEQSV